jgi:phage major head subunit gpT-like protein
MTITRGNIPSLLRPGLAAVFWNYNVYPHLYKSIYSIIKSDKAAEYDLEMQGLPIASEKDDGGPVTLAEFTQGYTTIYQHKFYAIGYQITRGTIEDNLYEAEFPQQALQLRTSIDTLRNVNGAFIFNNAFNTQSMVSDGQPLCSTQHPISGGILANTFDNPVGLSNGSLEEAIIIMKSWKNLAGLPINTSPVKLLVPPSLQFTAARILKSSFDPGTANNAINPLVHDKYFPGGYIINPYLTNPYNYFILTDEPQGFKMYQRSPLDIDFITDVGTTDNTIVRAVERYSFGCSNWRAVFGGQGTSA